MKKEIVNKLFDQWVEAEVLRAAGPDEVGHDAWHQSVGAVVAYSQMFLALAGDQRTCQRTYLVELQKQAEQRSEEVLAGYRARLAAATEKTAAYAALA